MQEIYTGVLRNYLSFRIPNEFDSNIRRWEEQPWWTAFLDKAVAISVYEKPGVVYNLSACEKYVTTQPVGSIKTLIAIHGADGFLKLIEGCPPPKNPKYKRLILEAQTDARAREEFVAGGWKELDDVEELELRAELGEGYREIARLHCLRREEYQNDLMRQRIRGNLQLAREKKEPTI